MWAEAANKATDLSNMLVKYGESKSSFQIFFGKGVKSNIFSTKIFGEMVVIADQTKIKEKFVDQGNICVFLGYASGHAAGTYCIWNPETKKVIISQDVMFL